MVLLLPLAPGLVRDLMVEDLPEVLLLPLLLLSTEVMVVLLLPLSWLVMLM